MSAFPVQTTEPDPAATSLPNEETVNKTEEDTAASIQPDALLSEPGATNGSEPKDVKDEGMKEEQLVIDEEIDEKANLQRNSSHRKYENHSKYDPSVLGITDDPKAIRAQVEFYFGDTNLPTDNYLWDLTDGSTNIPVPLSKILDFGRMKRFQPVSAIASALRESAFLEVEGPEGLEKVKRKVAYDPATPRNKGLSRTIYAKGFGEEDRSSQFDIEAFFAPFGPTNAVRLRRTDDKSFKGSVFVEFQDEETAKKFLELDPKPLWKGKDELKFIWKKDYMDAKNEDIRDGKMEPAEYRGHHERRGGRGRGRGRGGNVRGNRDRDDRRGRARGGDRDPDDWKKRREDDRANGFRDDKNRNDRRGRGSRRGDRNDRGPRNNDRNRERDEKVRDGDISEKNDVNPEVDVENLTSTKKRSRENDDNGENEAPFKKVDAKITMADEKSS